MTAISVLQVIPSVAKVRGGPSAAMPIIEQALLHEGVAVETATTDDDGPGRRAPSAQSVVVDGITRHIFPKQTNFYTCSRALTTWLAQNLARYDLVHTHGLFSHVNTATARIARRQGVPYVIRPIGTLTNYGRTQKPNLKKLSLRFLEGPALSHAAAVQFTSSAEQKEAMALGIDFRPVVIPLGVRQAKGGSKKRFLEQYPEARDRQRLLFISRIDPKKNVEALIDAVAVLAERQPNIVVIVSGSGEAAYEASLKARAEAVGVTNRLIWTGFVDGQQKADAFAAATCFVLPSFSENFGVAAVEALMSGTPCILGRGIAIAQDVESSGAGLAVKPEAAAIAEAIDFLLSQNDLQSFSHNARQLAQTKYSAGPMGRRLKRLYEEIVLRSGGLP